MKIPNKLKVLDAIFQANPSLKEQLDKYDCDVYFDAFDNEWSVNGDGVVGTLSNFISQMKQCGNPWGETDLCQKQQLSFVIEKR